MDRSLSSPRSCRATYNYAWEVIEDPSGDFKGRRFRKDDIDQSASDGVWMDGTTFRNIHNGITLLLRHGKLMPA